MSKSATNATVADSIQERITGYAYDLNYEELPSDVVHAAKVRIIDTLGALVGGYFGEPCNIVREMAAHMPQQDGATIIGSRMKTTPDMAAFVNTITARYPELIDSYHWPGSFHGHASETIPPLLAAGEYAGVNGRDFINAVVLAYEVFLRISDVFSNRGFDQTNLACISGAAASGKLLGLSRQQLAHCISMAVVPNIILRQVRIGQLSMFKAVASGQAGRAAVFAALLAKAGMEGPYLPFEGKSGWCDHIALKRFSLDTMGGQGTPFKIPDTQIKMRASDGSSLACVIAGEKIAPLRDLENVEKVIVELAKEAKEIVGTGAHQWNPANREAADHSAPYIVAVTLIDGTVTLRSYNDTHLWDPRVRALMPKIEIIENPEYTKAFFKIPVEHRVRITVLMKNGERLVAETGGDQDDFSAPKSDAQIEEKFKGLTEEYLGSKRMNEILDRLWRLDEMDNVAEIPKLFTFC